MLSRRRRDLLRVLLDSDGPRTLAELAARLKVSARTVRYDLDHLEGYLKQQGLWLRRRPRVGVWLEAVRAGAERLADELVARAAYDCVLSPTERQQFILAWLLRAEAPVRVRDLAESLYVSRTTVFEDLKRLERRLARSGMRLERKPHAGIRVAGNEVMWRRAAGELLGEAVGDGSLLRPTRGDHRVFSQQVVSLIGEVDVDRLAAAVRDIEDRMGLALADGAFIGLVIHLALAVKRLRAGKTIEMPEDQLAALRERPEFRSATVLAGAVENALGVALPPSEVGYITLHLLGARMRETVSDVVVPATASTVAHHDSPVAERGSPAADYELARVFVQRAEALLGVPLKDDVELLWGLALHLRPIADRLRYGAALRNPLLEEIKSTYPEIFQAAQQCSELLGKAWGVDVPEEEVGYLAMHLGAAIERRRSAPSRPRVLVACGSGVGTAKILESRIRNELPEVEVAGVVSSLHAAGSLDRWMPLDLIVSTVDLALLPGGAPGASGRGTRTCGVPAVRVNPLLGAEDLARIRAALTKSAGKSGGGGKGKGRFGFGTAAVSGSGATTTRKGQGGPMLHEVLTRNTILLDVDVENWEEAVRAAGRLLVQAGAAEERYVEAMVRTVRELGPYIVIGKGMAMPHARPEAGSRRIALSLVRLRRPVAFGHAEHDPVDLVFGLAAIDAQSHLTALRELSQLLSDPDHVSRIRSAATVDEVVRRVASGGTEGRG